MRARHFSHLSTAVLLLILLFPRAASAHVNSPDVYYDGNAGPYHLLVTIRPPAVVPGIAQIEIRVAEGDVDAISIRPMRLTGPGATLAPTADATQRSSSDPHLYTGQLWIMSRGSWKVQVEAAGAKGKGELGVPLPAVSTNTARMDAPLGALLAALGAVLLMGLIGIIGAATREAGLATGEQPSPQQRNKALRRMTVAGITLVLAIAGAGLWWRADARASAKLNYKLPRVKTVLAGNLLRLTLENPNAPEPTRFGTENPERLRLDDLIPDHGHLMHLFLLKMPDMTSFWHLHPDKVGESEFAVNLPLLPAGHYLIYADIVHHTGFPETQVGVIDLPALAGEPLSGDDSGGFAFVAGDNVAQLPDGYRMVWQRDDQPLRARQPIWFRFRIEDRQGRVVSDLENYMGMSGHMALVSRDGNVFAHVHPAGSVSMAAVGLAVSVESGSDTAMNGMHHSLGFANVSFPYGFPEPGEYRLFVQIKRAGHVETGVFIARVTE